MHEDEPHNFSQIQEEINNTSIQLLIADAGLALTFLSIAETSHSSEKTQRNIHNARKAYDTIQGVRARYTFTDAQTVTLDSELHRVRRRLEALGQTF